MRMPNDEYRKWLLDNQNHGLDTYGDLVTKLSGGGLALSFTFLRFIAGPDPVCRSVIGLAWFLWVSSLVCVLSSHLFAAHAMEEAIRQYDADEKVTGGKFDRFTRWLNVCSVIAFVLGTVMAGWFAIANLEERKMPEEQTKSDAAPVRTAVVSDGDTLIRGRVVSPPAPVQKTPSSGSSTGGGSGSSQSGSGSSSKTK